ncbi:MAG: TetR family transcriptional regulator [Burkholderiaceae bacterium]
MPRVSRAEAQSHREAITDASSRLFRERGLKAVSVADLMNAAGLTHGGFYGHFESKDALAAEATAHAFRVSAERWRRRTARAADVRAARTALIEPFLDPRSVPNAGQGCPTVALASDVAREDPAAPVRGAYADGLEELLAILAAVEQAGDAAADRRAALADYATMAGALLLARATAGTPLSDELLAAVRGRLLPEPSPATVPAAQARQRARRPARKEA